MTINELFMKYLPNRRFKSIQEAGESIFATIEFGYAEGLITDEVYLENIMPIWMVACPHVPITFRLYRS